MPDPTMVELVADELQRISDRGELASRAALREAVGMGSHDLDVALAKLADTGRAVEVEVDGFRVPSVDEEPALAPPPAVGVSIGEGAIPTSKFAQFRPLAGGSSAQVSMPRAVADVLDAAALGALLKAGIDTAPAGATFVFEVTP